MGDSYQPIQLPQGLGTGEAMAGVGDALTSAAQWSRQRRMDAADLLRSEEDKKRRAEQDFQAAYTQAQKMAAMGDLEGAKALLAPHVKNLQLAQEASPGAPGTSSMAAQAAPRIAPLDGAREPAGAVPGPSMPPLPPGPQGEGPPPTGNPGQMEAFKAPPGTPPPPTVVPPPNNSENEGNPLFAAAAEGKAKKMRQLLRFTGPSGQEMSLDPEKARETRMARLDDAFGQSEDPMIKEIYPRLRPALMASNQDVDPSDVFKYMQGVATDRRQQTAADEHQRQFEERQAQAAALRREGLGVSTENSKRSAAARIQAAGITSQPALKASNAAGTVVGRLDTEFDRWSKQQNWKGVAAGSRQLKAAMGNIVSGNPLAEKDAQIQLARFFRGAMPTEGEMHMLYANLGGRLGQALPKFIEDMSRGGLSPEQKNILKESIDVAQRESDEQIANIVESARTNFGPGSGHENLAGNINARVKGLFRGVGVKVPDVFAPGDDGSAAPTVTLGQGNPLVDATKRGGKGKGAAPPKSNPLFDAAAIQKLAPADRKAVEWAIKHPNAPEAKEILSHNGL